MLSLFHRAFVKILTSGFLALATLASAQQFSSSNSKSAVPYDSALSQDYVISPDDVLTLYVVDVPEFSRDYRVSPDGKVTLPLLPSSLQAAGQTLNQFSTLVAEQLKSQGLVSNPSLTTSVKESRTHSVAITGAVKKPQIYPVFGQTTLLDVLSQAEGLSEDAGSTVNIVRGELGMRISQSQTSNGSESEPARIVTVDLGKLLETGDPKLNVSIFPGDRITVPAAGIVYVVGAVNRPGGFPLTANRKQITVLEALALAEDPKSTAKQSKAMIVRPNPRYPDGREEIPIKLNSILAGKLPDVPLQASDILFVPDSSAQKALRRSAEAAIQLTTGILIYHP
jgi:polysaccharide biosynthesis/export protein